MKVTFEAAIPKKNKNGEYYVAVEEVEREIDDLGRDAIMCNMCGAKDYPECKTTCIMVKTNSLV